MVGSMLAAGFSLQLWNAHLHVPFVYGSDGLLTQMLVKQVVTGGWIWTNHSVGAPFGLQLFDFPVATDDLNFLTMKLLGVFTSDSAKVMNVWFLLTFPAEALTAYVVLRWLGASAPSSVVCAILFADSPYHLLRGETHLLLSDYVSVPMAAYLIISILDDRRLWIAEIRPLRWRSLICWRNAWVLLLCVTIGSLGVYYAVFALLLVGAAGLASTVNRRSWRPIVQAIVVVVLIAGVSGVNDIPAVIYRHNHGTNTEVAHRLPQESEIYALKMIEMVFPVPGHRIGALARLRYKYDTTNPVPSEDGQQTLGIVSTIGFAWILLIGLGAIVGMGREAPWLRRQRQLAFAAIVAFVVGTLGGLSAVIGYLITAQLRGWDRISIFIMFFSIATVALGLDAIGRRYFTKMRYAGLLGLLAILVIGIYDQSSLEAIPTYTPTSIAYNDDNLFVHAIQKEMPRNSAIFQLPYMSFPETPAVNQMQDYDPLRGYVHSSDLRWSYPTMTGRPQDWSSQTQTLPVPTLLDGIIAAGFDGLWIDRLGYVDGGTAIIQEVQSLVGEPPMASRDGTFVFFDLRQYASRLRQTHTPAQIAGLGDDILHPPQTVWQGGFYAPEPDGSRWALSSAQATVDNTTARPRRIEFFSQVQTFDRGRFHLTAAVAGRTVAQFNVTNNPEPVEFSFTAPPGISVVSFTTDAPAGLARGDTRQLAIHYATPVLSGAPIAPFVP